MDVLDALDQEEGNLTTLSGHRDWKEGPVKHEKIPLSMQNCADFSMGRDFYELFRFHRFTD